MYMLAMAPRWTATDVSTGQSLMKKCAVHTAVSARVSARAAQVRISAAPVVEPGAAFQLQRGMGAREKTTISGGSGGDTAF